MSSHTSLDASAQERKARLAQLRSLKRKEPPNTNAESVAEPPSKRQSPSPPDDVTTTYLSGRNFDAATRGPKLGFEVSPAADQITLEQRAEILVTDTEAQAENEANADKPLDLFQLQPKKPNWDLKRDLEKKLELLDVRTNNAIARIVRERIETSKRAALAKGGGSSRGDNGDGEEVGMEGASLVEAMHVREREEEEEAKREREDEDSLVDGIS